MRRDDMKAAAKFQATCATCGATQPRPSTAWTVQKWMDEHEAAHRLAGSLVKACSGCGEQKPIGHGSLCRDCLSRGGIQIREASR